MTNDPMTFAAKLRDLKAKIKTKDESIEALKKLHKQNKMEIIQKFGDLCNSSAAKYKKEIHGQKQLVNYHKKKRKEERAISNRSINKLCAMILFMLAAIICTNMYYYLILN